MPTVSARVPQKIYDKAVRKLKAENSSISELINNALYNLIDDKKVADTFNRKLSQTQKQQLKKIIDSATIHSNINLDLDNYKEIIAAGRMEDYENLS